jgi:hypothetical protein
MQITDMYKIYLRPLNMFQQAGSHLQGFLADKYKKFLHPSVQCGYTLKITEHTHVTVTIHRCSINVQDFKLK